MQSNFTCNPGLTVTISPFCWLADTIYGMHTHDIYLIKNTEINTSYWKQSCVFFDPVCLILSASDPINLSCRIINNISIEWGGWIEREREMRKYRSQYFERRFPRHLAKITKNKFSLRDERIGANKMIMIMILITTYSFHERKFI